MAKPKAKDKAIPMFTVLPKIAKEVVKEDWEEWNDMLATWTRTDGAVRVAHLCDVHFPDQHEAALNLAYRIIARKQPHVIVVGSDTFDFGLISSFDKSPDRDEEIPDEIEEAGRYWIPHVSTLDKIAPKALKVWIDGNHDKRVYKHVEKNAPKLRRVIQRMWVELIRQNGRVLWLGRRTHIDVGHLCVQHGDRTGDNAAKMLLDDLGYQVSTMAGHIHRMTSYVRKGHLYTVSGVTSGCLCSLDPYYRDGDKLRRPWSLGTAVATVNLRGKEVLIENIDFQESDGKLVVVSDGRIIEQPMAGVEHSIEPALAVVAGESDRGAA